MVKVPKLPKLCADCPYSRLYLVAFCLWLGTFAGLMKVAPTAVAMCALEAAGVTAFYIKGKLEQSPQDEAESKERLHRASEKSFGE